MSSPTRGTESRTLPGWVLWVAGGLVFACALALVAAIPTYQVREGVASVGAEVIGLDALADQRVEQVWDCDRLLFSIDVANQEERDDLTAEIFAELETLGFTQIDRQRTQRDRSDVLDFEIVEVDSAASSEQRLTIYAAFFDTDATICIPESLAPEVEQ